MVRTTAKASVIEGSDIKRTGEFEIGSIGRGCVVPVYRPRDAEHTVLHQVIALHLEVFLDAVAGAGDGLGLQFVEPEFREFLTCGVFEPAWRGFSARAARASTSYRFRARGARGVQAVGAGG